MFSNDNDQIPPEDINRFMNDVKHIQQLFKNNPKAALLLKKAQNNELSEDQFLYELSKLSQIGELE